MRFALPCSLVFAAFVAAPALAQDPPKPAWVSWTARFTGDARTPRAFVSVGRSAEPGPADYKSELAEDGARQEMGQLIADWQERALKCAKQVSDSKVTAKTRGGTGATLDLTIDTETIVGFYRERVIDRAYDGQFIIVLLRHELAPMIAGIQDDPTRSQAVKTAVRLCGEKAFDELLAKQR